MPTRPKPPIPAIPRYRDPCNTLLSPPTPTLRPPRPAPRPTDRRWPADERPTLHRLCRKPTPAPPRSHRPPTRPTARPCPTESRSQLGRFPRPCTTRYSSTTTDADRPRPSDASDETETTDERQHAPASGQHAPTHPHARRAPRTLIPGTFKTLKRICLGQERNASLPSQKTVRGSQLRTLRPRTQEPYLIHRRCPE